MKKEEKDLLLRDLCGRLPYGVIIEHEGNLSKLDTIFMCDSISVSSTSMDKEIFYNLDLDEVKPYLFPLSSMTEEQYNEFFSYYHNIEMAEVKASGDYLKAAYLGENAKHNWLDKNHFDYHYLIPMGLAKDATGLNVY